MRTLDNQMALVDLLYERAKADTTWVLTIPSYTRPHFAFWQILRHCPEALKRTVLAVHADEEEAYRAATGGKALHYLVVPPESYGVGYTRDYVLKWAESKGYEIGLCFDDDITHLEISYGDSEHVYSRHTKQAHHDADPLLWDKILCAYAMCAKWLFANASTLVLGNMRRQHFAHHPESKETLAYINRGSTPRQTCAWRLKGYSELDPFPDCGRWHGDDLLSCANVLQKGYNVFSVQWLMYDFVQETQATTLRDTDENTERNRRIHAEEYMNIRQFDLKNYLRVTKTYPNGDYMYGDVDYTKFGKLHPSRKGFGVSLDYMEGTLNDN